MDISEFKSLPQNKQEIVLEDALRLFTLIQHYPATYDDIETFVRWQRRLGFNNGKLSRFLDGVYPRGSVLDDDELAEASQKSLDFVKSWNKYLLQFELHYGR